MTSNKRQHHLSAPPPSGEDPTATPWKRRRGADARSGNEVVRLSEFLAVPPSPAQLSDAYLTHWQSLLVFLLLDEDTAGRAWLLLQRTVGAQDFAQLAANCKPHAVCAAVAWLAASVVRAGGKMSCLLHEVLAALCASIASARCVCRALRRK